MEADTELRARTRRAFAGLLLCLLLPVLVILLAFGRYSGFAACLLVTATVVGGGTAAHYAATDDDMSHSFGLAVIWALEIALAYGIAGFFQGLRPSWVAYLIAIAAVAGTGAAGVFTGRPRVGHALGFITSGALAAYLAVATALLPRVADQAESVAGDAPYCIQVASNVGGYDAASTLLDLSGLTMWARGNSNGGYLQYHAVLVVGTGAEPRLFNWSYRQRTWTRLAGKPVVYCRPQPGFVQQLPIAFGGGASETEGKYLHVAGRTFVIPSSYQPKAQAESTPILQFLATPPDFAPLDSPCVHIRDCIHQSVGIYFRPQSVMSWLTTQRAQVREDEQDVSGPRITRISCGPPEYNSGLPCEHVFLRDGMVFRFKHRESDLAQWREMQDRLVDRVRSFQPLLRKTE